MDPATPFPRDNPASQFRDDIFGYAQAVLREFAGTRIWAPASQLRVATSQAAQEYSGRFLLELIQNAHDQHPRSSHDGRITVVVDADEGDHGVVYVANAGAPFTSDSFRALCKLAATGKAVGEGIGHKGVGFRSVLGVCPWPEIYSADPDQAPGNLDGYSFRFAAYDDLVFLTAGDAAAARRAQEEMPAFQIPVPADAPPPGVKALADDGHVTVIRLPLASQAGLTSAMLRLSELARSDVPVLLFLERIASMRLVRRKGGEITQRVLTRREDLLEGCARSDSGLRIRNVNLGVLGDYVVSSVAVDTDRVRAAVTQAQEDRLLPAEWKDWDDATVSVAVPFDGDGKGRTFTFLPMGEKSPSPFAGHLNAPFFTKLDRTDIDAEHPLNSMLLDAAAELALTTSLALRATGIQETRGWVTDLFCWHGPHRSRLTAAARRLYHVELADIELVPMEPTAGHPDRWGCVRVVARWPNRDQTVLTAERAAATGAQLVDAGLGERRLEALSQMGAWLGCPLTPTVEQLADWVEGILATVARPSEYVVDPPAPKRPPSRRRSKNSKGPTRRRPWSATDSRRAETWAAAYADLPALFGDDGRVLQDRQILVDELGTLAKANTTRSDGERRRANRSAFLPPTHEESLVAVPASLRHRLYYLHPAVADQLTGPVRAFLIETSGVVRRYDARGLLEHVQAVLADSKGERLHRDALRFVFNLGRGGHLTARSELDKLGLQVPGRGGLLVPAARAVFGPGWPERHGEDLALVIAETAGGDPGLAALAARLVEPSSDLVRRGETRAEWAAFLTRVGVRDGLPIMERGGPVPKLLGDQLRPAAMTRLLRLPEPITATWTAYLATLPAWHPYAPATPYMASTKPVWILGQDIAEHLPPQGRAAYARLVLHGLSSWPQRHLETLWERDRPGHKDSHRVPTPLDSFLVVAPWAPAALPGSVGVSFTRLDDLWHVPAAYDDAEPAFASLLSRDTRIYLEDHPRVLDALRARGVGLWGARTDAARLVRHLGEAAAEGRVVERLQGQFLRAYQRAWSDVAQPDGPTLGDIEDLTLVFHRGHRLDTSRVCDLAQAGDEAIYLAEPGAGLHLRLLEQLELPLMLIDGDVETVQRQLAPRLGALIRVANVSSVTVHLESDSGDPQSLTERFRWLALLVAAAADHGQGLTMAEGDFTALAGKLRSLRIAVYDELRLTVFGHPAALPDSRQGLLALTDDPHRPRILCPVSPATLAGPAVVILAEETAVAVGRPDLKDTVRAAVLELQASGPPRPEPTIEDLAGVLRLRVQQVETTQARLDGGVDAVMRRLYPVLVHWSNRARADEAAEAARGAGSVADIALALAPLAGQIACDIDAAVEAARAALSPDELRKALGIEFGAFNDTLRLLRPAYEPLSHRAAHEQALRGYLALHHRRLTDRLRWARLDRFDRRQPQPDWPTLRSLDWTQIPPLWDYHVDEATTALLETLVEDTLGATLGAEAPHAGEDLPVLETVRAQNRSQISRAAPAVARLVRAWCSAHRRLAPTWATGADVGGDLAGLLDAAGALDFRPLGDDDVAPWIDAIGVWPPTMLPTVDAAQAGVTQEQLDAADTTQSREQQEREHRRRSVTIGGAAIDVAGGDLSDLIGALEDSLAANGHAITAPARYTDLARMPPVEVGSPTGGTRGGGGGFGGAEALSDAQRNAIGSAGEWFAYHWLTHRYQEANETSWVSRNRRHVFAGHPGDDTLGYDFKVDRTRETFMFEVKATRGDPGELELGDSEVRAAQRNARNEHWRLLVVANIFDPDQRSIHVLPNPMNPRWAERFRIVGRGIRYQYRLTP